MPIGAVAALTAAGSPLPYAHLVRLTGRARLRRAVAEGIVVRLARGRYGLAAADRDLSVAREAGGSLSHVSAAVHHGWGVLRPWEVTCVTLRRGRHPSRAPGVRWSYAPLSDKEVEDGVTDPVRTVIDCARTLPPDQALAVVDSALRSGHVLMEELTEEAAACRSPGIGVARRVLARGDARAANPFESALRAIVLGQGLDGFVPQLVIAGDGLFACVDLGDPARRVAFEADGYGVHGSRRAFARDLARHDELQTEGWVTRRFAFEHVLHRQPWVARQVCAAAGQRVVGKPQQHKTHPWGRV